MTERPDIRNSADVEQLVRTFYDALLIDPVVGHFFTDLDLDAHIPRIVSFWNMILFADRTYQGEPMSAHLKLNARLPMKPEHFARWLQLFEGTVNDLFLGPVADEARSRARSIAGVMAHKVNA